MKSFFDQYTIALVALLVVLAIFSQPIITTTALVILFGLLATRMGAFLLPRKRVAAQFINGLIVVLVMYMVALATLYWLYQVTFWGALVVLVLIATAIRTITQGVALKPWLERVQRHVRELLAHKYHVALLALLSAATIGVLYYLFTNGSLAAIRSPWKHINQLLFFGATGALGFALWVAAWKKTSALRPLHLVIYSLLFTCTGLLIYKVGYGFDPFVHRATQWHIFFEGLITPKPLWYVGQHALVVALSHLSNLAVTVVDKLFLPTLAPLFIAGALAALAPESWQRRMLLLLLLPLFSWFIVTTPQGIANLLFLILIIQLPLVLKKQLSVYVPALLVAGIATLHPSTAVPAFLLFILMLLVQRGVQRKYLAFTSIFGSLLLPTLLFINEWQQNGSLPSALELRGRVSERIADSVFSTSVLTNSYYALFNGVYTLRILVFAGAAGLTIYGIIKLKDKTLFAPYLFTAGALLLSAPLLYLSNQLPLVISYEQSDYALRTLWLLSYTLLPFYWFGGLWFLRTLEHHRTHIIAFVLLILSAGMAANAYMLYPRTDRMVNHRGYSTSNTDITTVDFIEFQNKDTQTPYVVLANQSVSAAALRQLGFSKEFETSEGPLYAYPIPTGGSLYEYFLRMMDKRPTTLVAQDVMEFTGAQRVYLVINDYWWRDYRIVTEAKKYADWWTTIDGTTIMAWQAKDLSRGWLTPQHMPQTN